jgi:hypothetical protein
MELKKTLKNLALGAAALGMAVLPNLTQAKNVMAQAPAKPAALEMQAASPLDQFASPISKDEFLARFPKLEIALNDTLNKQDAMAILTPDEIQLLEIPLGKNLLKSGYSTDSLLAILNWNVVRSSTSNDNAAFTLVELKALDASTDPATNTPQDIKYTQLNNVALNLFSIIYRYQKTDQLGGDTTGILDLIARTGAENSVNGKITTETLTAINKAIQISAFNSTPGMTKEVSIYLNKLILQSMPVKTTPKI